MTLLSGSALAWWLVDNSYIIVSGVSGCGMDFTQHTALSALGCCRRRRWRAGLAAWRSERHKTMPHDPQGCRTARYIARSSSHPGAPTGQGQPCMHAHSRTAHVSLSRSKPKPTVAICHARKLEQGPFTLLVVKVAQEL